VLVLVDVDELCRLIHWLVVVVVVVGKADAAAAVRNQLGGAPGMMSSDVMVRYEAAMRFERLSRTKRRSRGGGLWAATSLAVDCGCCCSGGQETGRRLVAAEATHRLQGGGFIRVFHYSVRLGGLGGALPTKY
jgi:hypothetical protein